jgi:hypothetical protein
LKLVPLAVDFGEGMNVVGERVAVGDFQLLAGTKGEDMGGVLAALLIEKHRTGGNGAWIGSTLGNINDDVADRIARANNQGFGNERIGGVHLRTGGFFRKVEGLGFGWNAVERDFAHEFCASGRGKQRSRSAREEDQREGDASSPAYSKAS